MSFLVRRDEKIKHVMQKVNTGTPDDVFGPVKKLISRG